MPIIGRRSAIGGAGAALIAGSRAVEAETITLPFGNGERPVVRYPGKRPLIRLTTRPPQLETPLSVYDEGLITPNDALFVRYHLANLPYDGIDPDTFRLNISGLVGKPLSLSLSELKALPQTEVTAVVQCSGNGRGFFEPRMAGGQAGNGLMGNAVWRGVPLKTVLAMADIKPGAVQVKVEGLDGPVVEATPKFAKALDLDHAMDGEVMIAWSMNGEDLPFLNGYPIRLVVPGYFSTYWMKHLNQITVLDKPLDNFWMATAYRIPDNDCNCVAPGTAPAKTRPIGRMKVRSFITSVADGASLPAGKPVALRGFAFDGGRGIRTVEVSANGGKTWMAAHLGEDFGKYAFRGWQSTVTLPPGDYVLKVRATNNAGEIQPDEQPWNPSGYQRNVIIAVPVRAV